MVQAFYDRLTWGMSWNATGAMVRDPILQVERAELCEGSGLAPRPEVKHRRQAKISEGVRR